MLTRPCPASPSSATRSRTRARRRCRRAALAELGLARKWSYEAIEVAPERFAELVASLPDDGFAGVNVTVPHKLAALALAD